MLILETTITNADLLKQSVLCERKFLYWKIRDDKHDEFLSLSFPLPMNFFRLSKCIREWKKVGHFGRVFRSHEKLSPCPDRAPRRWIKEPLPNFAQFPENGCYMTYSESPLRLRTTCLAFPYSTLTPIHFDFSPTFLALLSLLRHARRCTFLKLHSPAYGNSSRSFFFFSLFSCTCCSPRIRAQSELLPYAPSALFLYPIIGIDPLHRVHMHIGERGYATCDRRRNSHPAIMQLYDKGSCVINVKRKLDLSKYRARNVFFR